MQRKFLKYAGEGKSVSRTQLEAFFVDQVPHDSLGGWARVWARILSEREPGGEGGVLATRQTFTTVLPTNALQGYEINSRRLAKKIKKIMVQSAVVVGGVRQ